MSLSQLLLDKIEIASGLDLSELDSFFIYDQILIRLVGFGEVMQESIVLQASLLHRGHRSCKLFILALFVFERFLRVSTNEDERVREKENERND